MILVNCFIFPFYFRAAISACYYARLSCLHSQTLAACLMFSDKLNWRLCDGKLRIACSTPDRPEWCRRPSRRPLRWWPSPSQPRSPDPLSPPARAPHRHHCNCRNTQGDSDVTQSTVNIRSPFCGYYMAYCVELADEDLSCYSNKTQPVWLKKVSVWSLTWQ